MLRGFQQSPQSFEIKWEFVEIASLPTHDTQSGCDTLIITQNGNSTTRWVSRPQENSQHHNMGSGFSIYAAILADSVSSTSEQFKDLMAHMCLMIQFIKNLGSMVWLQYDHKFRIWAAGKGMNVWEELLLTGSPPKIIQHYQICSPEAFLWQTRWQESQRPSELATSRTLMVTAISNCSNAKLTIILQPDHVPKILCTLDHQTHVSHETLKLFTSWTLTICWNSSINKIRHNDGRTEIPFIAYYESHTQ